jgi:arginyl-tRNA synthetase
MDFDMDLAKERSQKNPVFYVQYAHARIASILQKADSVGDYQQNQKLDLLNTKEELNLIRKLVEYPEVLENIAESYEINRLPRYTLDLSREFHNFYEKCRVITEDENLTSARLALVSATKVVIGSALSLMGISAPDKM